MNHATTGLLTVVINIASNKPVPGISNILKHSGVIEFTIVALASWI
jgi:hypothetical protein